jgi:hypothetical protein
LCCDSHLKRKLLPLSLSHNSYDGLELGKAARMRTGKILFIWKLQIKGVVTGQEEKFWKPWGLYSFNGRNNPEGLGSIKLVMFNISWQLGVR